MSDMPDTQEEYEPRIIGFLCHWCLNAGADQAGVSRFQFPPNIRIIWVMCSGMVHPNIVIEALMTGADGVLICGCHPGNCHYLEGNLLAERRSEAIEAILQDLDLETERYRLELISASEGQRFSEIITEMVKELKDLGPNPYNPN